MNKPAIPALALAGLLAFTAGCASNDTPRNGAHPERVAQPAARPGLGISDAKIGQGKAASAGEVAVVHYTGWLYDPASPGGRGRKFDSSRDRGRPFSFTLGAGQVIR